MWRGAKPADCSSRCKRLVPFIHSYIVMPEAARYKLKQSSAAVTCDDPIQSYCRKLMIILLREPSKKVRPRRHQQ